MAEGDTFDPTVPIVAEPTPEPVQQELPLGIDEPPPGDVVDIEDGDEEEIETIEVEIGGKKYVVPKAVEDHLLREEDYTQKTQTLAEQRKEVEAYQQQLHEKAEIQAAVLEDISVVRNMDAQLQEYDKIDWPAYQLQDANAAQYHYMQYQQLRGFRDQAAQSLNQKMQHVSHLQSQSREATIQKTITALAKPDPEYGWPGYSPAYIDRLDKAAEQIFGLTQEERSRMTAPKSIKILNAAVLGVQSLRKAAATPAAPAVEAKPVRQISSNRSVASSSGSGDNKSVEKWVSDERARMAKKAAANGSGLRLG